MGKKHRNRVNAPKKITIFQKKASLLNRKHMVRNMRGINVRTDLATIPIDWIISLPLLPNLRHGGIFLSSYVFMSIGS